MLVNSVHLLFHLALLQQLLFVVVCLALQVFDAVIVRVDFNVELLIQLGELAFDKLGHIIKLVYDTLLFPLHFKLGPLLPCQQVDGFLQFVDPLNQVAFARLNPDILLITDLLHELDVVGKLSLEVLNLLLALVKLILNGADSVLRGLILLGKSLYQVFVLLRPKIRQPVLRKLPVQQVGQVLVVVGL